jgi:restriction endonuclease S subunit
VLRSPEYQELLDAAAFESARKTLNLDALGAMRIPVPAITIQEQWLSAISSIKHRLNEARIRTEALRGIGATVLNLENEVNA